jgi:hypothetical protein
VVSFSIVFFSLLAHEHSMMNTTATNRQIASRLAITLFVGMSVFQVLVSAGLMPINILWGGSQNELTLGLRFASIAAVCLLIGMALVIYQRSHHPSPSKLVRALSWIITVYLILNTIGNFLSQNTYERFIFGSVTTVLAICCWIVSSSPHLRGEEDYEELV